MIQRATPTKILSKKHKKFTFSEDRHGEAQFLIGSIYWDGSRASATMRKLEMPSEVWVRLRECACGGRGQIVGKGPKNELGQAGDERWPFEGMKDHDVEQDQGVLSLNSLSCARSAHSRVYSCLHLGSKMTDPHRWLSATAVTTAIFPIRMFSVCVCVCVCSCFSFFNNYFPIF